MNIRELQKQVHQLAKDKGWYDTGARPPLELYALIMSELGEAVNEVRKNLDPIYFYEKNTDVHISKDMAKACNQNGFNFSEYKPEGEAIELADVVIRILDYCEYVGIDLQEAIELKHNYNKTRPYRHGMKKY